jgi:hypothetical protein
MNGRRANLVAKIKNFRVPLRPREIARWLKKERGMETTPELELEIENWIKASKAWITPAAVYSTITRQTAEKTTSLSFPKEAVAVSIAVVSIGPALEKESQSAPADAAREPFYAALAHEGLSQSVQFAMRLLGDQAKEEDCEMSMPVPVTESALASSFASFVGVSRIGVELSGADAPMPSYSRVCYAFWTPIGKSSSRRTETSGRVAKVAA